jgi:acetyl esterase/lipase
MGYAAGLEVALKEREAEVARLRAWGERFEQSFYDTSSKAAEYRAEIDRLQAVEQEALRVLGAVIYYHGGGRVVLAEETLLDDYTVERDRDVVAMKVRLKAWPTARHEP